MMPERPSPAVRNAGGNRWLRGIRRVAFFCLLWILLSGGAAGSWTIGVPMVAAATLISLRLWHGPSLSLLGLLRFLPWFARQSLAGAVDVAIRALRPDMPLAPGMVRHHLRLPEAGASRIALANVISMLPGTLSADLDGNGLTVHALDARQDLHGMVADLEPRIAAVFDVPLEPVA
jgi:multicomponent Na+:H+ antiporter subunit E